jgi:hypothetical protein
VIAHNNKVTFGLWSAVTVTVQHLLFIIGLTMAPPTTWNGTSIYQFVHDNKARTSHPLILAYPCNHRSCGEYLCYAPESNKIFGLMGIVFTTIYAVMGGSNYFIQIATVRQNI